MLFTNSGGVYLTSEELERRKKEKLRSNQEERKKGQSDIIEWLLRQNEYMKYASSYKLNWDLKAGEIYEVDFGINVNNEFSYRHLALVLADSNINNPLVMICPLKSNSKGAHPTSDLNLGIIEEIETHHDTLAVINQIRSIDKIRIYKKGLIGKSHEGTNRYLNDSDYQLETYRYRLDKERLNKVIEAFKKYLETGYILK